jgi:hypothetical protein
MSSKTFKNGCVQGALTPAVAVITGCEDLHELCEVWAADGECTKNNVFMVGDKTRPGSCLVSCKRCDLVSGNPQPEVAAHQQPAGRT